MELYFRSFIGLFVLMLWCAANTAHASFPPFMQCQGQNAEERKDAVSSDPLTQTLCEQLPQHNWGACAQATLEQLTQSDPALKHAPVTVVIINHQDANAFLLNNRSIALTSSLLEQLEGAHDLSFVIGHELGHFHLHQQKHTSLQTALRRDLNGEPLGDEFNADAYSLWLTGQSSIIPHNLLIRLTKHREMSSNFSSWQQIGLLIRAEKLRKTSSYNYRH